MLTLFMRFSNKMLRLWSDEYLSLVILFFILLSLLLWTLFPLELFSFFILLLRILFLLCFIIIHDWSLNASLWFLRRWLSLRLGFFFLVLLLDTMETLLYTDWLLIIIMMLWLFRSWVLTCCMLFMEILWMLGSFSSLEVIFIRLFLFMWRFVGIHLWLYIFVGRNGFRRRIMMFFLFLFLMLGGMRLFNFMMLMGLRSIIILWIESRLKWSMINMFKGRHFQFLFRFFLNSDL